MGLWVLGSGTGFTQRCEAFLERCASMEKPVSLLRGQVRVELDDIQYAYLQALLLTDHE